MDPHCGPSPSRGPHHRLPRARDRRGRRPGSDRADDGRGTAVVADLRGADGPTVGFRFDMDCLPVLESAEARHRPTAEGFRSQVEGEMHACGHDGHMAIGLGVATVLARVRDSSADSPARCSSLPRRARMGGAAAITARGLVDDVDHLVCVHLGLGAATGTFVHAPTSLRPRSPRPLPRPRRARRQQPTIRAQRAAGGSDRGARAALDRSPRRRLVEPERRRPPCRRRARGDAAVGDDRARLLGRPNGRARLRGRARSRSDRRRGGGVRGRARARSHRRGAGRLAGRRPRPRRGLAALAHERQSSGSRTPSRGKRARTPTSSSSESPNAAAAESTRSSAAISPTAITARSSTSTSGRS